MENIHLPFPQTFSWFWRCFCMPWMKSRLFEVLYENNYNTSTTLNNLEISASSWDVHNQSWSASASCYKSGSAYKHLLGLHFASMNQHFSERKYLISIQRKIVPRSKAYLNRQRIFVTFISAPDVLKLLILVLRGADDRGKCLTGNSFRSKMSRATLLPSNK